MAFPQQSQQLTSIQTQATEISVSGGVNKEGSDVVRNQTLYGNSETKSKAMIAIGSLMIGISVIMVIICIYSLTFSRAYMVAGFCCAIMAVTVGSFAVLAGSVDFNRNYYITVLTLSILSAVVNFISLTTICIGVSDTYCADVCKDKDLPTLFCETCRWPTSLILLLIASLFLMFLTITTASLSCRYVCSCCCCYVGGAFVTRQRIAYVTADTRGIPTQYSQF